MKMRTMTIDDMGDMDAPAGSKPWAVAVRLKLHRALQDVEVTSDSIQGWVELLVQHEGYKRLNDRSGLPFREFEDFCCAESPFGLGYAREHIDRVIGERRAKERKARTQRLAKENAEPLNAGAGRPKGNHSKNGNQNDYGTTASYRIRKLRRDFPAIAARLDAGEFKSVAAAERASKGIDPDPPRKTLTPLGWLRCWWAKATKEDRRTFLKEVSTP